MHLCVLDVWESFLPITGGQVSLVLSRSCPYRKEGSGFTHELQVPFCLVWSYASICSSVDVPVLSLRWDSLGLYDRYARQPFCFSIPLFFLATTSFLSFLFFSLPLSTFVSLLWIQMYFKNFNPTFLFLEWKRLC